MKKTNQYPLNLELPATEKPVKELDGEFRISKYQRIAQPSGNALPPLQSVSGKTEESAAPPGGQIS